MYELTELYTSCLLPLLQTISLQLPSVHALAAAGESSLIEGGSSGLGNHCLCRESEFVRGKGGSMGDLPVGTIWQPTPVKMAHWAPSLCHIYTQMRVMLCLVLLGFLCVTVSVFALRMQHGCQDVSLQAKARPRIGERPMVKPVRCKI